MAGTGRFLAVLPSDQRDTDVRSVSALVNYILEHGPFTHVVYSAGINQLKWIKDYGEDPSMIHEVMMVNVIGFSYMLSALEYANAGVPCRVVAVSSDAAERPMRGSLAYCASKAALNMAVRVAARELGPAGWRVNAVAPGMTEFTEMQAYIDRQVPIFRGWSPAKARSYEDSQNPLGRRATTDEVAELIQDVLLGSDYMNGSIITLNGGR